MNNGVDEIVVDVGRHDYSPVKIESDKVKKTYVWFSKNADAAVEHTLWCAYEDDVNIRRSASGRIGF